MVIILVFMTLRGGGLPLYWSVQIENTGKRYALYCCVTSCCGFYQQFENGRQSTTVSARSTLCAIFDVSNSLNLQCINETATFASKRLFVLP